VKVTESLTRNTRLRLVSFLTGFLILSFLTPLSFAKSPSAKSKRHITKLYSHYLKGLMHLTQGDYSQGLEELKKAKAKDPQSIHIRLKIAATLVALERIKEAEDILNEAKKIDPDNLDVYLALIFVYSYTQENEDMEKEYGLFLEKAHQMKPKDVGISEYLAQFYFYKKKPQEAIKIYEKVLETSPDNTEALFWLGYLYDESGDRKRAIASWEKGLEVDPSHAPLLNALGYVYAEEGINLDQAEKMIKKALVKEPENGAYLDSLGWVYFKKKNLPKAQEYLSLAIGYMKDPDIYKHLGDLFIKLGDTDEGLKYYRQGFLEFPERKDLEELIKQYEKEDKTLKE
jgi:tetratricopeptide (TPR) repeat protein